MMNLIDTLIQRSPIRRAMRELILDVLYEEERRTPQCDTLSYKAPVQHNAPIL